MDGSRRRGRPRKSWKDNIKEWTGQSKSSLLCVAEDRRRWAATAAEASVGVPERRLGVTSFWLIDWLIDEWISKTVCDREKVLGLTRQVQPAQTPALYPYANFYANKSAHQLLVCAYFTHFAICPRTLGLLYKCSAVSKASSNFSSEEHQQFFRIKRGGVSPRPALGWASCSNFAIAIYSLLVDGFIFRRFDARGFVCYVLTLGLMPPPKYILA